MLATKPKLEILDLRHFSAAALRPLLEEEAAKWERRLFWNYDRSVELLLEYINNRSLTGYVAMQHGRVAGYAFGVCEAAKAVVGDVYAFGEGERAANPVCERLLDHLLETLQATPGLGRVESQLLLFPGGALREVYASRRFRPFERSFMVCELHEVQRAVHELPAAYVAGRWQPEAYLPAAALIRDAYVGHTDSEINDQYRTLTGAQRFLHNIVHFPGCGIFDSANSWVVRSRAGGEIEGMVLCSRVRKDAAHITQLCVREEARGRGIGTALLRCCLGSLQASGIRTVSLTVTDSNKGAVRLYEAYGFRVQEQFEAWVWDKHRA